MPDTYGFAAPGGDGGATYGVNKAAGVGAAAAFATPLVVAAVKAQQDALRKRNEELKKATAHQKAFTQEVEKATQRNKQLAAQLRDGSYARHARDIGQLNREYAQLQRAAQVTSLVAQHGRLGAAVRLNATQYQTLGRTMLYGAAGAALLGRSLMTTGLQGTVEGYRLEYAWTRLSRQIAGVAIPAVDKMAEVVGGAASWFQSLNRGQQDTILNLGLIAVGATVAAGAFRTLATVGGAALAVGRGLGAVAGMSGAAAAGGTAAGAVGTGAGTAAAAAGGGLLARAGGLAKTALKVGAGVAGAGVVADAATGGFYSGLRDRGNNKLVSGIGALGGGALDLLTLGAFGRNFRGKGYDKGAAPAFAPANPADRRDVTPLQVATDEIGGAFDRIQEAVLKVTSAEKDKADEAVKKAAEETAKNTAEMAAALKQIAGDQERRDIDRDVRRLTPRSPF